MHRRKGKAKQRGRGAESEVALFSLKGRGRTHSRNLKRLTGGWWVARLVQNLNDCPVGVVRTLPLPLRRCQGDGVAAGAQAAPPSLGNEERLSWADQVTEKRPRSLRPDNGPWGHRNAHRFHLGEWEVRWARGYQRQEDCVRALKCRLAARDRRIQETERRITAVRCARARCEERQQERHTQRKTFTSNKSQRVWQGSEHVALRRAVTRRRWHADALPVAYGHCRGRAVQPAPPRPARLVAEVEETVAFDVLQAGIGDGRRRRQIQLADSRDPDGRACKALLHLPRPYDGGERACAGAFVQCLLPCSCGLSCPLFRGVEKHRTTYRMTSPPFPPSAGSVGGSSMNFFCCLPGWNLKFLT